MIQSRTFHSNHACSFLPQAECCPAKPPNFSVRSAKKAMNSDYFPTVPALGDYCFAASDIDLDENNSVSVR